MGRRRVSAPVARAVLLAGLLWLLTGTAAGHEVVIDYEVVPSVELHARVGGGEPMAGGIVEVYPPGADSPTATGVCNDRGRYVFRPEPPVQAGTWRFRVRGGGHAHVVEVPLGGAAETRTGSSRLSPLQYAVMIGCALWGLLGTALYVTRRRP
jgi:nickel transport protein